MKSIKVQAFLSCSRDPNDEEIVRLVRAICIGIDIECFTVDRAHSAPAGHVALDEIKKRPLFIAIATRRLDLHNGTFATSDAIKEEIAYAHVLQRNIVLIQESGVVDGSMNQPANYIFDRADIHKPEFLEKVIASLHDAKMQSIQSHEFLLEQGPSEFFLEENHSLRELVETTDGYEWHFSNTRRVAFTQPYDRPLKYGAFPAAGPVTPASSDLSATCECKLGPSSKAFTQDVDVRHQTADAIDLRVSLRPTPQKGDFLTITINARSKYFSPIFRHRDAKPLIEIEGKKYFSMCGCIASSRSRSLKICYIIPQVAAEISDLRPFAAFRYLNHIDEPVEREMHRIKAVIEPVGGKIIARIEVEEPLFGYAYGLVWNPILEGSDPYHPI